MQPPMIETLRKRLTDREHPARLHLIGVAGSGMSGLALMLMEMGHRVSGCDRVTSAETERLQSLGLSFSCPHSADAVSDAEIVIYSSAIRADNPALAAARKLNIPCMRRAECLAAILNGKKGKNHYFSPLRAPDEGRPHASVPLRGGGNPRAGNQRPLE